MKRNEKSAKQGDGASSKADDDAKAQDVQVTDEDAKRQEMRKRKPLGEVVKPLTKEQIEALLGDPEVKERENLIDALPKGWDNDYQDEF